MPNPYNGKAGNLGSPGAVSILSSTDATPIVVRTSSAHGLVTGDAVWIYDHTVNVNANGEDYVTVVDATHFQLDGSVGSGAGNGGATGTVQPLTFNPSGTNLLSDGVDNLDASNIHTPVEHLLDRTALLNVFAKSLITYGGGGVRVQVVTSAQDKTLTQVGTASMNNTEVELSNSRFTLTKLNQGQNIIWSYCCNVSGTGTPLITTGFVCYAPGGTPGALTPHTWEAMAASQIRGRSLWGCTTFTGFTGGNLDIALMGYSAGVGSAAFYGSYSLTCLVIG